jgi:uncharacterized membrane protein
MPSPWKTSRPLLAPGIVLGMGLGGFVDGIVLHQVLQWHHLMSGHGSFPTGTVPGLQDNVFWDGFFHVATLALTGLGVGLMWRTGRRGAVQWDATVFIGCLLAGWGLFNLADGLINHHLLGLHHVREDGNELAWDLGWLGLGAIQVGAGFFMIKRRIRG